MPKPHRSRGRRVATAALQTLFLLSLLWSALFAAWQSLRPLDFGYPLLYELLDIDAHIERYGPRNRYRGGFETTDTEQRLAIFSAIGAAINDGGRGLAEIRYQDARGRSRGFLRPPERTHLESVARVITTLRGFSYLMLGVLASSLAGMWALRVPLPRPRRVLLVTAAGVVVATLGVIGYGAEEVFNTLHTWVFPPGEQWFFYYEESLMTTLMKAPDLFAGIAVLLVLLALAWFSAGLLAVRWLWRRPVEPRAIPARG